MKKKKNRIFENWKVGCPLKGSSHFINFEKMIKKIEAEGILYSAGNAD